MKNLIAYFSRKGNNYVGGSVENLPVGNTEVAAKMIQKLTGADIFRIATVKEYPADYNETTDVARQELRQSARPQLSSDVENLDGYGVIFLGYPNWWGTMPMPVCSFLDGYDLSKKIIAPFCTHEGSGLGRSLSDLKKMCPHSTILDGLAIRGGDVRNAKDTVAGWLQNIAIAIKK
jgi:flavodoxin